MKELSGVAEKIILIIAYSNEVNFKDLSRLFDSENYLRKLIYELEDEKYLKIIEENEEKYLRLTRKMRKDLLKKSFQRFNLFFSKRIKSEYDKRYRYHLISQVLITMINCNIEIKIDVKPKYFSNYVKDNEINKYYFYTSTEVKQINLDIVRNSRFTGLVLVNDQVFIIYNIDTGSGKWLGTVEIKLIYILEEYLKKLDAKKFNNLEINTIVFGKNLEVASEFIKINSSHNYINTTPKFYFLSSDNQGEKLLKFLLSNEKESIDSHLLKNYQNNFVDYAIEHDGVSKENYPILISYIIDIPRLLKFLFILKQFNKHGIIYCFDNQVELIKKLSNNYNKLQILTLSYTDFEKRFLNWTN